MDVFSYIQQKVHAQVQRLAAEGVLPAGLDLARITAELPRDEAHGDVATNAALILAKPCEKSPKAIAQLLANALRAEENIAHIEIAGPGFINLTLKQSFWAQFLEEIDRLGEAYGHSCLGAGIKVNVEYISANPTGPLHVGHCRGAVYGDALASLLSTVGYDVTREYYINDAGGQIDILGQSAYLRYRQALGEDIGEIPPGLYPADYLKPVGVALAAQYGRSLLMQSEKEWLPCVRARAVAMMMDIIRDDLMLLGIKQEIFFSEKSLHDSGALAATLDDLRKAGLIYIGRLPPPKGEQQDDWEDREQTLFKTTQFGDDIDRPLLKSDGSYTYFASDVAYSRDKIRRGFRKLIYVLGADHGGYIKRLEAIAAAQSPSHQPIEVSVRVCQLVKLYRDGEPIRMSKRSGDFVTLRALVAEVGADAVRFMMLYRKNEAALDFDLARAKEQTKDNPVFYVQYAHARICSVLRHSGLHDTRLGEPQSQENQELSSTKPDFNLLTDPGEMALIRRLSTYPRLIEQAAGASEPHRIAFYLHELAGDFHALWNKGKESPQLRFILKDDIRMTATRLAFLQVIRRVLANGLRMIGVRPVEEM